MSGLSNIFIRSKSYTIRLLCTMKHSNISYNSLTKMTLIDNSLIKDLEIAKARQVRLNKNKEKEKEKEILKTKITSFEMSESHDAKPYLKKN